MTMSHSFTKKQTTKQPGNRLPIRYESAILVVVKRKRTQRKAGKYHGKTDSEGIIYAG